MPGLDFVIELEDGIELNVTNLFRFLVTVGVTVGAILVLRSRRARKRAQLIAQGAEDSGEQFSVLDFLFSFKGRISRIEYFIVVLLLSRVEFLLLFYLNHVGSQISGLRQREPGFLENLPTVFAMAAQSFAMAAAAILIPWVGCAIFVRRMHDFDWSGRYMLSFQLAILGISLISLLSFLKAVLQTHQGGDDLLPLLEGGPMTLFLMFGGIFFLAPSLFVFWRGTAGTNRFGEPTQPNLWFWGVLAGGTILLPDLLLWAFRLWAFRN